MSTAITRAPELFSRHPESLVEATAEIGPRTRIWAFAHVLAGAKIGADCNICDQTFIEGGARIGDRVTLKCGVQVWEGVTLEDDVFVGPNATFTNDPFPRSRRRPAQFAKTVVRKRASIGANATILPGITIGADAMVGAGAVVTSDVPPRAIVMGNPAAVTGYVDAREHTNTDARLGFIPQPEEQRMPGAGVVRDPIRFLSKPRSRPTDLSDPKANAATSLVGGASLVKLPRISDPRGQLSYAEIEQLLPFRVARYFLVFGVPNRKVRGEHAHRTLQQFLVCVHGSCSVRLFDGTQGEEVLLNRPEMGLFVPPMVWATQYKYSADAVLMVLASEVYNEDDYIRDLDQYLAEIPTVQDAMPAGTFGRIADPAAHVTGRHSAL